jgi:hypothetical protein
MSSAHQLPAMEEDGALGLLIYGISKLSFGFAAAK